MVLALAVTGSCPKPVHRHKHVAECTCTYEAPRTIMLPPPETEIEPIPMTIYRYYVPLTFSAPPVEWDWQPSPIMVWGVGGRQVPAWRAPARTPEIDGSSAASALTLLVGGLAVMRGRRSQFDTEGKHDV